MSEQTETAPTGPCVYFISQGDAIKIGFSENVARRWSTLQSGHHELLTLIGTIPATIDTEQFIHAKFRHLWIRGEWFTAAPEIIEFIANPILPPPPPPKPAPVKPVVPVIPFPMDAEKFDSWANAVCGAWPVELQGHAYRAAQALKGHSAYPPELVDVFSDGYSQWVASKKTAGVTNAV